MIRDQRHYEWTEHTGAAFKAVVEALVPLKLNVTSVGNGADQTEDVLSTFSIPANTMGANGVQGFEIDAWGTFGATGDNKQVKLYFGAVNIASGVVTDNAKNWHMRLKVYRSGLNTQVVVGDGQHDTTVTTPTVTTGAEVETGAIIAKVTGQETTASTANQIVVKAFVVKAIEQAKAGT